MEPAGLGHFATFVVVLSDPEAYPEVAASSSAAFLYGAFAEVVVAFEVAAVAVESYLAGGLNFDVAAVKVLNFACPTKVLVSC